MHDTWRERLGTDKDGGYVVVDVTLEDDENPGPWGLTDHSGSVTRPVTLHVMGEQVEKGHRNAWHAGQISEALAEIVKPAPGWTLDEIAELRGIWDRWHLNTMRGGCVHQTVKVWENTPYRRIDLDGTTAHPNNACPVGYRYGSAWLAEILPDDVQARVRHLMRDRSGDLYRARGYDGAGKAVPR
jgi:hypothetical protein